MPSSHENHHNNREGTLNQIKHLTFKGVIIVASLPFIFLFSFLFAHIDNSFIIDGIIKHKDIQNIYYKEGLVDNIFVKEGDIVQKSQPLVMFSNLKLRFDIYILAIKIKYNYFYNLKLISNLKLVSLFNTGYINSNFNISSYPLHFETTKLFYFNKFLFYIYKEFIINNFFLNLYNILHIHYDINFIRKKANLSNLNIYLLLSKYISIKNSVFNSQLYLFDLKLELLKLNIYILEEKSNLLFSMHLSKELNLKKIIFVNEQSINISADYVRSYFELLSLEKQFSKLIFHYRNTIICSPISGVINNINIAAGMYIHDKNIIEIIPQNKDLFIEAFCPSHEVDNLFLGSFVKMSIGTYNLRYSSRVIGKIVYISADKFLDDKFYYSSIHYKIKILICNKELSNHNISLYPALPVKIFIIKGKKNIIEYFISVFRNIFYYPG